MFRIINRTLTIISRKISTDKTFSCSADMLSTIQNTVLLTDRKQKHLIAHNKYCTKAEDENNNGFVSEEDIKIISGGDADLEHKLRVIILEADVMKQDGKCVPSLNYIKHQHWKELLALQTRTARAKYLTFLFKTEKKIENKAAKKEDQRIKRESEPKLEFPDDGKIRYHLGGNHMFLRIYETTMNNMYNNRLMQAMQFGQKLIIDCGYHKDMTTRENTNCAKQLMLVFADNRLHDDPFDLHFCNLQKTSSLEEILHRFIPTMYDTVFPINLHEKSYLDVFPEEKLIYLTPHCKEEMVEYDHDAIYIIGAIVDKVNNQPLSLAKAKQEGMRMAKLPLDRYLHWGSGSGKSLTLNQVTSILLDMKHTGDWSHSLRHVPRRKIMSRDESSPYTRNDRNDKYYRNYTDDRNDRSSYRNDSTSVSQQLMRHSSPSISTPNDSASSQSQYGGGRYSRNHSAVGSSINRQRGLSYDVEDDLGVKQFRRERTFKTSWRPNKDDEKKKPIDIKSVLEDR